MTIRALAAGALFIALVGAACGDGDNSSPTPTRSIASPAATAAPTPVACPSVQTTRLETTRLQQASAQGLIATLDDVQATMQPCLDRVTFTFNGDTLPGYDVRYVQNSLQCGSGEPVYTQGFGQLAITFTPANAHDEAGKPTIGARSLTPSYSSIKEVRLTCDFEAVVSWVLGTEIRYFTVTTAQSPARIVVDVYH